MIEVSWTLVVEELDRLTVPLHAIWAAGRDDAAARRDLRRLLMLCGEVTGLGRHDHGDDPLYGWKQYMREVAKEDPHGVHLGALLHGGLREVVGICGNQIVTRTPERRPFPPAEAPDAARACLDVIRAFKNAVRRAEQAHKSQHTSAQFTSEDWHRLGDFPKDRRRAIAKAAERGHVQTKRVPEQRALLYLAADVVKKWGPMATPRQKTERQVKRQRATLRDK